jgi:hypothetical protein
VCVSVCASPWLCVGMQQPIAALKASVDWGYYEIGMPSLAKQAPRTTFKEQKCSLKLANTPQMHMGSDMQTMIAALIKHPPDRIQNFRHASPWYYMIPDTNRTAQGRGGSLKDRKPVGEVWLFCQSPGRIVRESIQLLSWDRTSDNKSYPIWFRKNRATPSHPAIVIHFFTIPI